MSKNNQELLFNRLFKNLDDLKKDIRDLDCKSDIIQNDVDTIKLVQKEKYFELSNRLDKLELGNNNQSNFSWQKIKASTWQGLTGLGIALAGVYEYFHLKK